LDNVAQPNEDWSGAQPDPGTSKAPYRIYNIGSNNPVELSRFIEIIEERVGKKAEKNLLPLQPGDVPATYANVDDLINDVDYKPSTTVEEGIANFVDWYRHFYKV
jgi:UDP-glucuronate 4-epimerase